MVACGTSGLLGGRFVDGLSVADSNLMSAVPACGFFEADAFGAGFSFGVVVFLVAIKISLKISFQIPHAKAQS